MAAELLGDRPPRELDAARPRGLLGRLDVARREERHRAMERAGLRHAHRQATALRRPALADLALHRGGAAPRFVLDVRRQGRDEAAPRAPREHGAARPGRRVEALPVVRAAGAPHLPAEDGVDADRAGEVQRRDLHALDEEVAIGERGRLHGAEPRHVALRALRRAVAEEQAAAHVEHAPVVLRLARLDREGLALDHEAEAPPVRHDQELGHRRRIAGELEGARQERGRARHAAALGDRSARPDVAVGDGQARLDLVLARRVEAGLVDEPGRVVRQRERPAERGDLQLMLEDGHEPRRPAADVEDAGRRAPRLGADRDHRRAGDLRDREHQAVAPLVAGDRAELVAGDQHVLRGDVERLGDGAHHVGHGVALVGEADLDVLDVAGDARVLEAEIPRDLPRQLERLAHAVAEAGAAQPGLGRGQQLGERALGRIAPGRLGDEIDLAPVEPIPDHPEGEPGQALEPPLHLVGDAIEGALFLARRRAPPQERRPSAPVEPEELGAAVGRYVEAPRRLGRDVIVELPSDVGEARPGDDHRPHPRREHAIQRPRDRARVRGSRHHRGPIPVEDDEPKRAIELGWEHDQRTRLRPRGGARMVE